MDTRERFSPLTITLHWLVALGILGLIAFGIYMVKTESWPLYHIHKSFGLLIFTLALLRALWRWKNGFPQPLGRPSPFEHLAALWMHRLLLACTLLMPLTGMLYSAASGNGFGIFSLEIFPANPQHDASGAALPLNAGLSGLGQNLHDTLGYLLLVLIILHAAAAVWHHFMHKDQTLNRMLGRKQQTHRAG